MCGSDSSWRARSLITLAKPVEREEIESSCRMTRVIKVNIATTCKRDLRTATIDPEHFGRSSGWQSYCAGIFRYTLRVKSSRKYSTCRSWRVVLLIILVWLRVTGLRLAGVSCNIEIASEFRYRKSVVHPNSLMIITLSQSGETADTWRRCVWPKIWVIWPV